MIINNKEVFNKLPDAILFDTDNTLYEYAPAHKAGMDAVQSKIVSLFSITNKEFINAFDASKKIVKKRLGYTAASHNRLLYFQGMLEMLGLGSQVLLALDFEQTYWRAFLNKAVLFSGLKSLLDDLRSLEIPTAIVTDLTAQIQFRKLVYFDLEHCFDYIVTSEEAGADKPDAAPFKLAIDKIQPKGNDIWMIGDNHFTDMQGAYNSISALTFFKKHKGTFLEPRLKKPDIIFNNFNELKKMIKKIR